jgi:CDP-diacylglycerol--glycerol-3-phosphate 3-phosphatidyltransferase/cardiolipin synthase
LTLPNAITLARVALVPVFLICMSLDWRVAALVVFSVAAATDFVDGYLARKMMQVTNFGKIMDPLADKLLVLAALVYFAAEGTAAVWVVVTVLAREFLVSALRIAAASEGTVLAADLSGKIKTVTQIFCVIAILSPWAGIYILPSLTLRLFAAWLIAAVTVWSGIDYLVRHRTLFRKVIDK